VEDGNQEGLEAGFLLLFDWVSLLSTERVLSVMVICCFALMKVAFITVYHLDQTAFKNFKFDFEFF
jgi:hypothetical protein